MGLSKIKEKNPNWKGDDIGYKGIHIWFNRNLKKPEKCQKCNKEARLDLANKSGKYLRDETDWEWLCRRCHMLSDGRMEQLINRSKAKARLPNKKCKLCDKDFVEQKNKKIFCSQRCYFKFIQTHKKTV